MKEVKKHNFKLSKTGKTLGDYSFAECSCGWKGARHGNYNNYLHSMIRDDFYKHLKEVMG